MDSLLTKSRCHSVRNVPASARAWQGVGSESTLAVPQRNCQLHSNRRHMSVAPKGLFATPALVGALALGLSGCTYASQALDSAQGFDVSAIQAVPEVAALVPEQVRADKILTVAAELTYPPMEFVAGDGQTAIGLDIDIAKALARVMGLDAQMVSAGFDSIIPAIGAKYEVGISAFTITPERLDAVNMVPYFSAGSQFATRIGNSAEIDPEMIPFSICGTRIAVQIGTVQQEDLLGWNDNTCSDNPINIFPYETQADATANLIGGKVDAMYADSPIVDYALLQTAGRLELLGEMRDGADYGVVVAKNDEQLAQAVQAALHELMADGTLQNIAAYWGNAQGVLTQTSAIAELGPICGNTIFNAPSRIID